MFDGPEPSQHRAIQRRPVVGVTNPSANGTAEDPYLIQGWCILPEFHRSHPLSGIWIRGTDAHVVIHNNTVGTWQRGGFGSGILVKDAANVTASDNTLTYNDRGISIQDTPETRISHNIFIHNDHAVYLSEADRTHVDDNAFTHNHAESVLLLSSNMVSLTNNTISHAGPSFGGLPGASGIQVEDSKETHIVHNTITDNGYGILLNLASGTTITQNNITHHRFEGVTLDLSPGTIVTANNFHDNEDVGLEVEDVSNPIDARKNWWGAASGPSGGVKDACTAEIADGAGDAIVLQDGAEVCFDPWRTSPNPDAGAN